MTHFQLFFFQLFVLLLSPQLDRDLYECSGMSVFFSPLYSQYLAKCLALKRHLVNFCWMNEYAHTGLHTHICTYGTSGSSAGMRTSHNSEMQNKSEPADEAGTWLC